MAGPLTGLRVIELAALGPAPMACTFFADLGAEVIRVDRIGDAGWPPPDLMLRRSRRSIALDLKQAEHVDVVVALAAGADVLIEGFRPGVAERLGVGPDALTARNERLVYARMTGWGQAGPLAGLAGHDIDYIAVGGLLGMVGRPGQPPDPPLNVVGDFGGGAMFLVGGVLAALFERARSGRGQVLDVAMADGVAYLVGPAMATLGDRPFERHMLVVDGGAPFYGTFECADGRYVAVGAIEPQFYARLLAGLGLDDVDAMLQDDRSTWPTTRRRIAGALLGRPRDAWLEEFDGLDACVAPVLAPDELRQHQHHVSRGTWFEHDGVVQPLPAPRFERSEVPASGPAPRPGQHTREVLTELGWPAESIDRIAVSHAAPGRA
jgi:alpha-methylacyl-CoA racemase